MYKLALILRYLRRKLSPLFAALAVTLCTAMVIIVISVMGGFLDMMRQAVQTLEGQVIIKSDMNGFGEYQRLIDRLTKLPEVKAATPVITTYGLLGLPSAGSQTLHTVELWGIEPTSFDVVVNYRQAMFWTRRNLTESLDRTIAQAGNLEDATRKAYEALRQSYEETDLVDYAMRLQPPTSWGDMSAIVPGIHVSPSNVRDPVGNYDILNNRTLGKAVTLTVLPITSRGTFLEPASRSMVVVNEFKSGLYEIDANRVFVPFAVLQRMLRMDAHDEVDDETGQPTGRKIPGRCSQILVAMNHEHAGITLASLKDAIRNETGKWLGENDVSSPIYLYTWEEKHSTFLGAVQNEKMLITILFCVVSLVAFTMIAVVFYMIVLEKTRDIGVLRALGASRMGMAGVFLGYGLAIGIVGSLLGLALAASIVLNLNEIQTFLGQTIGWQMWNPQVYYFDRIPAQLNASDVMWVVLASIASSVLGALVPAIAAARLNPVEALRYE